MLLKYMTELLGHMYTKPQAQRRQEKRGEKEIYRRKQGGKRSIITRHYPRQAKGAKCLKKAFKNEEEAGKKCPLSFSPRNTTTSLGSNVHSSKVRRRGECF